MKSAISADASLRRMDRAFARTIGPQAGHTGSRCGCSASHTNPFAISSQKSRIFWSVVAIAFSRAALARSRYCSSVGMHG